MRAYALTTSVAFGPLALAPVARAALEGFGLFKDVRLFPGGAREWDWTEFGTHHRPGPGIAEVRELVDRGVTTVILSRGVLGHLQVPEETLAWLRTHGVAVEVLWTEAAVSRYNALCAERVPVGALIHSTC